MNSDIELCKVYLGKNSTRESDVVKQVSAEEFLGKAQNWTKLGDLNFSIFFQSENPSLDEVRGPIRVLAKVSKNAANIAGLANGEGWYATDIPTNSF
jgi:hypothetical protein